MRTISETWKHAQAAESNVPHIRVVFHANDGKAKDYSHRLTRLEHREEPYNDAADIYLYNNDRGVADVKGSWIEIEYGTIVDGSPESIATPRLWVKSQQLVSREGDLFTVVHCEGMWSHLQEIDLVTLGEPPWYEGTFDETYTIYDTIKALLAAAGFTLRPLGGQDDGIINTLCPQVWINQNPFENPAEIIYRLLAMTKCFLRPLPGLEFKIIYPQESDATTETYHYDSPHYFFEYAEKRNLTIPNYVVVYYNASGDDNDWDAQEAIALDEESIDDYKEVRRHHIAADLDNQSDAENRASAILTRYMFEALAGRAIVPHDCRVEIYDKIEVYDARG